MNSKNTSDKNQEQALNKTDVMQSVILSKNLRKGNFLINTKLDIFKKGYVSLEARNIFEIAVKESAQEYNDYVDFFESIPINEEWLLNFGFKRYPWGLVVDKLLFKDDLKCSYLILQVGNGFEVTVNYVHELQNLYHSLTGRELTVA